MSKSSKFFVTLFAISLIACATAFAQGTEPPHPQASQNAPAAKEEDHPYSPEDEDEPQIPSGANEFAVLPSDTDSRITEFNTAHICLTPQGTARNQLFLFIPGTGGQPRKGFPLAETAANLGYHVIELMYPDNLAAQVACGRNRDPDAHIKFRMALIRGGRLLPDRVIQPADSIESRLFMLLSYLRAKKPDQGWGQFLTSKDEIDWSKFAVSGQSQGGGHAYVLGKYHKVARVIMTGSPKDYSFIRHQPAKGFDGNTMTPLNRFFAFNHVLDNGNGCTHDQQTEILQQIGLFNYGTAIVNKEAPPYKHAHVLYIDQPLPQKKYHGSPIGGKLPCCVPTWKYMLTEPVK
jgi:hypothetical protein